MRKNEFARSTRPEPRSLFSGVTELVASSDETSVWKKPVSQEAIRRGRVAAGALALAGSAAFVMLGSQSAEAKSVTPASSKKATTTANKVTTSKKKARTATTVIKTYTVKRGDTLSAIAAKYGVSVSSLASSNNLSTRSLLPVGKTLSIPVPSTSNIAGSKKGVVPGQLSTSDPRFALRPQFQSAAAQYGVPSRLLMAMTWNESGWQNNVRSNVGARGIGQIMPATAKHINESLSSRKLNPNNTSDNIKMSAIYLRYLLDESNGDQKMALAAYYQGLASVRANGLYDDTKQYIRTITALQRNYF